MSDIKAALKKQQEVEGYTLETALLLKVLPLVQTQSEWMSLTRVKHHRYGHRSYECHHFHYPSPLLMSLVNMNNEDLI